MSGLVSALARGPTMPRSLAMRTRTAAAASDSSTSTSSEGWSMSAVRRIARAHGGRAGRSTSKACATCVPAPTTASRPRAVCRRQPTALLVPWDSDTFAAEGASGGMRLTPRARRMQHQHESPESAWRTIRSSARDDVVGAPLSPPRRSPRPSRVVKRRVGPIAVLDRLLDREAIEGRERAGSERGPERAGRRR
jgi:hypothetical protein